MNNINVSNQNNVMNNNYNNAYNQNNQNNNMSNKNIQNIENNMNNNIQNINMNNINAQNKKIQNLPLPKKNNYFSPLTKAPKTGLKLLGDTSYLNAALQILGNCECLANYFLNPKYQKYIEGNIKTLPFTFVFYRLFRHLYQKKEKREIYSPEPILYVLGQMNCIYKSKTNKRRNPNELLSYCLNQIHAELNKSNNKIQVNELNINVKSNVITVGTQNFMKNYNSKISQFFNWFEIKELNCTKCGNKCYNFNTYNMLELDIMLTYYFKKQPITIYDCFKMFESPKTFKYFCQKCKRYTDFIKTSKIYVSPNYFIFSLDRKDLDQNLLKIPFSIDKKIEITNFVEESQSPKYYQLIGIMSYSLYSKSYVSFCMSPVDNQWYLYYNENVEFKSIDEIINLHNNQKMCIPCALIYETVEA